MVSERARRLIAEHITSIEQLEILLLLRSLSAAPGTGVAAPGSKGGLTAAQINDRIKSSLSSVTARLADLEASGFIRREAELFLYDPGPEKQPAVDDVAQAYAERRYTVIELIFAKPTDKLKVFARAFKLRGDDDG